MALRTRDLRLPGSVTVSVVSFADKKSAPDTSYVRLNAHRAERCFASTQSAEVVFPAALSAEFVVRQTALPTLGVCSVPTEGARGCRLVGFALLLSGERRERTSWRQARVLDLDPTVRCPQRCRLELRPQLQKWRKTSKAHVCLYMLNHALHSTIAAPRSWKSCRASVALAVAPRSGRKVAAPGGTQSGSRRQFAYNGRWTLGLVQSASVPARGNVCELRATAGLQLRTSGGPGRTRTPRGVG